MDEKFHSQRDGGYSQEAEQSIADFFEIATSAARSGSEIHGSNLRRQSIASLVNRQTDTLFHVIESESREGKRAIQLTWQSTTNIFPVDSGMLTFEQATPSGEIAISGGSVFNEPMPIGMFQRLGFRWAPLFKRVGESNPEPISGAQMGEVFRRLMLSHLDTEITREAANREIVLNVINNPKASIFMKWRVYNLNDIHGWLTETDLEAFAPKGYKEIKSKMFQLRLRVARLAEAAKMTLIVAGVQAVEQTQKNWRKDLDDTHDGHQQ